MNDIISALADPVWGIITGIIISVTVYLIVTFIPIKETARYKATFYRRKIAKLIINPSIHTEYHVKSKNIEEKQLKPKELIEDIKQKLSKTALKLKGEKGSTISFSNIIGKSEIEIIFSLSYVANEQDELIVDYVECSFKPTNTRYNDFSDHLLDLSKTSRKIEQSFVDVIGFWRGESLTCEIKRLYKFVGVLKDLNMSTLQGKIAGEYEIEIFESKLVVYSDIEGRLSEMLKDIITYYY